MRRRINTLITKNNVKTYNDYVALIKKDKEKFDQYINFLKSMFLNSIVIRISGRY